MTGSGALAAGCAVAAEEKAPHIYMHVHVWATSKLYAYTASYQTASDESKNLNANAISFHKQQQSSFRRRYSMKSCIDLYLVKIAERQMSFTLLAKR